MNHPLTGGCLCRKLRYEIAEVPRLTYTCHCTDCQHLSGGAFTMAIAVPAAAFRFTGIEPRQYRAVADSGRVKIRFVCPECGTWVWGVSSSDTGVFQVRAGTLDDTSRLKPTVHFWTRSKQLWVVLPESDQTFETQPAH
jgi:hypothetical protein